MNFTYDSYRSLLKLLRQQGYVFADYYHYNMYPRCVILRHDIDMSIEQAKRIAEVERESGVNSTFFVLLRTDFYNPASAESLAALRYIQSLGHEIGLHFDEASYPAGTTEETISQILNEAEILSSILGTAVTAVSMHRPSKATLEADLKIPGMVNSYSHTFFHGFKYISDSRRRWREPVEDIVNSGKYDRLHILVHSFWYHCQELGLSESVASFINSANRERYHVFRDNITELDSIMKEDEVR